MPHQRARLDRRSPALLQLLFTAPPQTMDILYRPARYLSGRLQAVGMICGCGHSGTTLIANILGHHRNIYSQPREPKTFIGHPLRVQTRLCGELARTLARGKRCLVEKRPDNIERLDSIRANLSNLRIIIPIRDGRDVAASLVARGLTMNEGQRRWVSANRLAFQNINRPDCVVYRHEDLIDSPETVLRKICDFLELPYDEDMLRYHERPRDWWGQTPTGPADPKLEHNKNRSWQVNQPIFDNRGRWKKNFDQADFSLLNAGEGRQLMTEFGYIQGFLER